MEDAINTVNSPSTPEATDPILSFNRLVRIISRIRGIWGYSALEPRAPVVMIIPEDDPTKTESDQDYSWNSDTSRLLKVVDERSIGTLETLLKCGALVNAHGDSFNETPLHRAAQLGWVEGVQLLLSHGATGYSTNQFGQTPLHYAAASKSTSCVRSLLGAGCRSTLDHKDMRGHTPLHDAASCGHTEGVIHLIKAGATINVRDKNEETPLHKAAKAKCIPSMLTLLNKGADISVKDKSGESVLNYVLRHIPDGMETLLDQCLVTNQDKITSKKLEIAFNFVPLAGTSEMNQMKILNAIVELGHPKLLLHPVCEAFLLLKWHTVRRLFFIEVIFYFTHAILATLLIIDKFVWQRINADIISEKVYYGLAILLYMQAACILLKQVLTICQSMRTWIFSLWHVLNAAIPILVLLVIPDINANINWQHHLATIAILLIWVQCMLHIGRFPGCGIYVAMFTRVAKVFLRIFLIFFCLLLAFSMSFYVGNFGGTYDDSVLVAQNTSDTKNSTEWKIYPNPALFFMKTLTMMIGELDFDSSLVNEMQELPGTSHILYLSFVILVSIILSNLLVALAVNDVQGLRNSAHLERLIKQMELVYQMEKTFGTMTTIATILKFKFLAAEIKLFVDDFNKTKVFMQPYNTLKGSFLLVFKSGVVKEIHLRQNHVVKIMECLRLREEVTSDRKLSVRKNRKVRSEYSTFGTSNDDLRDTLKQIERNLMDTMHERMDEVADTFSSLVTKIKAIELSLLAHPVEENKEDESRIIPSKSISKAPNGGLASKKIMSLRYSEPPAIVVSSGTPKRRVAIVRHSQPALQHQEAESQLHQLQIQSHPRSTDDTKEVAIEMISRDKSSSSDEKS